MIPAALAPLWKSTILNLHLFHTHVEILQAKRNLEIA